VVDGAEPSVVNNSILKIGPRDSVTPYKGLSRDVTAIAGVTIKGWSRHGVTRHGVTPHSRG
jgi:hypothetical protein